MLIADAEVHGRGHGDVRIEGDRITAIGSLAPLAGEPVLDAKGAALLPGLHDHHLHLAASAMRRQSVICGPPEVSNAAQLTDRLRAAPGTGWLRGVLYHESVMGLPDAAALDLLLPDRPLRIQHRGGRMWLFNSAGLDLLLAGSKALPPGLEHHDGRYTGRLFDSDDWLRATLGAAPPALGALSDELAAFGITGVSEMSPSNGPEFAAHLAAEAGAGRWRQACVIAGSLALGDAEPHAAWRLGPAKLHLHDAALPDLEQTIAFIMAAHDQRRTIAVHCTTEGELVFALAALAEAGSVPGDRIEHAGIACDIHVAMIADLGLAVVSQPHFITERGDDYLRQVDAELHNALYRLKAFTDAGVVLAAGSDAPFGSLDPWAGMASAVSRRTRNGQIIGKDEGLSPEAALALYLADPLDLARQRRLAVGARADMVLLDRPWADARRRLISTDVRTTIIGGSVVYQRVDQTDGQGGTRAEAPS